MGRYSAIGSQIPHRSRDVSGNPAVLKAYFCRHGAATQEPWPWREKIAFKPRRCSGQREFAADVTEGNIQCQWSVSVFSGGVDAVLRWQFPIAVSDSR